MNYNLIPEASPDGLDVSTVILPEFQPKYLPTPRATLPPAPVFTTAISFRKNPPYFFLANAFNKLFYFCSKNGVDLATNNDKNNHNRNNNKSNNHDRGSCEDLAVHNP